MDAIVYKTNTGFTEEYAKLLGEKINLPVYSLDVAQKSLEKNSEIIYFGWLMAGNVNGYKKALKLYKIKAVFGVGMGADQSQNDDVRKANAIAKEIPVFTLQGGFDLSKLKGMYKFMMTTMSKGMVKKLSEKADRTAEENDMLDLMQNGGSRVNEKSLEKIIEWYDSTK